VARLHLHVTPGVGRDELEGLQDGQWRAYVTARATDGQANRALLRLLSDRLGVPKSRIYIVRGVSGRHKVVTVDGLTDDELRARLTP
jgi:uncharacterized protein